MATAQLIGLTAGGGTVIYVIERFPAPGGTWVLVSAFVLGVWALTAPYVCTRRRA